VVVKEEAPAFELPLSEITQEYVPLAATALQQLASISAIELDALKTKEPKPAGVEGLDLPQVEVAAVHVVVAADSGTDDGDGSDATIPVIERSNETIALEESL